MEEKLKLRNINTKTTLLYMLVTNLIRICSIRLEPGLENYNIHLRNNEDDSTCIQYCINSSKMRT